MKHSTLLFKLKQFIGKKSWRSETTLCRFLIDRDGSISQENAEQILARLVERGDGVEWFLPARIERDEDKRYSTPLRYRLTEKGKRQVWRRMKKS